MAATEDPRARLSAELETQLLQRLRAEWRDLNGYLFGGYLRAPMLQLRGALSQLGEWNPEHRTISLSLPAILRQPWLETLEVLKHEMAHQFVDEVLGCEERAHGPVFQRVCETRGIDPAASAGLRERDGQGREDRIIARVKKLLALAQSSNRHEAELAASTAQRIMLKFNIEVQQSDAGHVQRYRFAQLGTPTGRVQAYQRRLAGLLLRHFFVEGIWVPVYVPTTGKTGHVLEICGRPENLEMAQFVHSFVLQTIERLWAEHKRSLGLRSNRDRRTFLAGAVEGFASKLADKRAEAQREGLVWVPDAGLADYHRRRYPRTTSTRYASRHDEAFAQGQAAGRTIVLSQPVTSGTENRGKALPPSRER